MLTFTKRVRMLSRLLNCRSRVSVFGSEGSFRSSELTLVFMLQVFRTDLITAMKVHDSYQLNPEDYYVLADPWRQEWEKGVQVPVSPQSIPQPVVR